MWEKQHLLGTGRGRRAGETTAGLQSSHCFCEKVLTWVSDRAGGDAEFGRVPQLFSVHFVPGPEQGAGVQRRVRRGLRPQGPQFRGVNSSSSVGSEHNPWDTKEQDAAAEQVDRRGQRVLHGAEAQPGP